MNEVAKLIESCSFHHPVPEENPNIREIPDRNFGVLFVVYTHLKDSPVCGFNGKKNVSLDCPRALIISNRREGVRHIMKDVVGDYFKEHY